MRTKLIGAIIALAGINVLLWGVIVAPDSATGNPARPSVTPATMPYPGAGPNGTIPWTPR